MKSNNTLLVTGGAGFIGANFVHYWLNNYHQDKVIVIDALTYAGNLDNLENANSNPNFVFVRGNICDSELVETLIKEHEVNVIVHFAAESHVDRSITGPDEFIQTNIIGTYSLLKAAKKMWVDAEEPETEHRFHHVSTDEVYGDLSPNDPPFSESTQYAPSSPYSASKAASDHLVRAFGHTYGLKVTTSNCSNNYGPYHFPEKLIPLVVTNILRNIPLPIYGDGKQIRDWLFVEDHARGIDLVLKKGFVGETYNIGGENEWANIDIVKKICAIMNEEFASDSSLNAKYPSALLAREGKSEQLISYVTDRAGHDRRYAIDPTKCNQELNYFPQETFETGIRKTIRWYLDSKQWWEKLLEGNQE